jgi:hypothetical protein
LTYHTAVHIAEVISSDVVFAIPDLIILAIAAADLVLKIQKKHDLSISLDDIIEDNKSLVDKGVEEIETKAINVIDEAISALTGLHGAWD